MRIATPGDAEEWMRSVNKRLSRVERRGAPAGGTQTEVLVVDDEAVVTWAPVVPSQPITEQRANSVAVTWDGLGAGDEQMPPNFATLAIHRSQEGPEFEPDEYTRVQNLNGPGTVVFTDQPYDEVFYYRFVMQTRDGQTSGPSVAAVGVAVRVGGSDLTADSIDGKLITGATIQTGTTGGRAVLRPGPSSSYGVGAHTIELWSGNSLEATPAEIICIADGPLPGDNTSVLFAGPEKTGYGSSRAFVQMHARDSDTISQFAAAGDSIYVQGQGLARYRTSGMEFIMDQNHSSGPAIWSSRGIDCFHASTNVWNVVASTYYTANGWSDYPTNGPYRPGIRWRYTHDSHIEVQLAIRTTAATTTNPMVLNAGHGMPMPTDYWAEGWVRALTASGYELLSLIGHPNTSGTPGKWQMLTPAATTYTVVAGMFTYRWRHENV